MRAFIIGFVAVLATVNATTLYSPIRHPDCPIDEDPFDPTHLPVPGDCTKFYKCESGLAYLMDCPARLHWSVYHNRCEHPDKIAIAVEAPIRHPECPLYDDPMNPTLLAYPKDCNKFYKCSDGLAYPQDCPAGLNWNDKAKICDWPSLANCVPKKILANFQQIKEDEKPIKHKDCPAMDDPGRPKHLPYPNNCAKFYKCSYGLAYPMDCPSGEHFGVEIDRCDWPKVAKCDPNIDPEPTTEPPTSETTSEPTTTESTTTESTTSETTPESTTAESSTETTTPTTTESTTSTTPEPLPPGIDCSNVPHGTLYPHPDDCQKFVHCDNGVGRVKNCPGILHFNPVLLVCDWPQVAGCKVNP